MEERDTLQLSIRLPVEALGRLSRLLEQVAELLEGSGGGRSALSSSVGRETASSEHFDGERFASLLRREMAPAPTAERAEAPAFSIPEPPVSAGGVPEAAADGKPVQAPRFTRQGDPPSARREPAGSEAATATGGAVSNALDAPGGPAAVLESVALPPSPAPAVERPMETIPAPAVAFEHPADIQAAEGTVSAYFPAPGGGRLAPVEELVSPGPAPLTAEAVALAFQRDDRRYDNGFPLY